MKYKAIRYIDENAFVAIIGGLFSLCLGGSILSIIEFISSGCRTVMNTLTEENKRDVEKYPQLYWDEVSYYKKQNFVKKNRKLYYLTYYDNFVH